MFLCGGARSRVLHWLSLIGRPVTNGLARQSIWQDITGTWMGSIMSTTNKLAALNTILKVYICVCAWCLITGLEILAWVFRATNLVHSFVISNRLWRSLRMYGNHALLYDVWHPSMINAKILNIKGNISLWMFHISYILGQETVEIWIPTLTK